MIDKVLNHLNSLYNDLYNEDVKSDEVKLCEELSNIKALVEESVELGSFEDLNEQYDRVYYLIENIGYLAQTDELREVASELLDLVEEV